jgi:hypothetical protein
VRRLVQWKAQPGGFYRLIDLKTKAILAEDYCIDSIEPFELELKKDKKSEIKNYKSICQ